MISAELELSQGDIRFLLGNGQETATVRIAQSRTDELAWITLPDSWETEMILKPSWEWVSEALLSVNCEAPTQWQTDGECGFTQTLPEDDPITIRASRNGNRIQIATSVGPDSEQITANLLELDVEEAERQAVSDWNEYWE